jgi:hypothetical protein
MAEGTFSKIKRAARNAFDLGSDDKIRSYRDRDETNSNLDFMLSRGKKRTPQDQSDVDAGNRIHKAPVVDTYATNRKTNREAYGAEGIASKAVDLSGKSRERKFFRRKRE